jgi:hypothetical protein
MRDDDESHAGVGRNGPKKILQGAKASGRGAYSDDRECPTGGHKLISQFFLTLRPNRPGIEESSAKTDRKVNTAKPIKFHPALAKADAPDAKAAVFND